MAKTKAIDIGNERICAKCKRQQPIENYRVIERRGSKYREGSCDACRLAYARDHQWAGALELRAKKQAIVNEHKNAPCMDCGNTFPAVCMDFDHVRGKKKLGITHIVAQWWSIDVLLEELAKCDLVCANCHRIRTHKDGGKIHRQRIREGRIKAGLRVN